MAGCFIHNAGNKLKVTDMWLPVNHGGDIFGDRQWEFYLANLRRTLVLNFVTEQTAVFSQMLVFSPTFIIRLAHNPRRNFVGENQQRRSKLRVVLMPKGKLPLFVKEQTKAICGKLYNVAN